MLTITSISTAMTGEALIVIGIAFWIIYFANSYENVWLKLFLKLFSTFVVIVGAYMPMIVSEQANRAGMYNLFAFSIMNGFIFFWALWFIVLFYELFMFFIEQKKKKLEETQ